MSHVGYYYALYICSLNLCMLTHALSEGKNVRGLNFQPFFLSFSILFSNKFSLVDRKYFSLGSDGIIFKVKKIFLLHANIFIQFREVFKRKSD